MLRNPGRTQPHLGRRHEPDRDIASEQRERVFNEVRENARKIEELRQWILPRISNPIAEVIGIHDPADDFSDDPFHSAD